MAPTDEEQTGRRRWGGRRLLVPLCGLASIACLAATVASLARGPNPKFPRVLASRVSTDGTAYLVWSEPGGLSLARQAVAPRAGGGATVSVRQPYQITIRFAGGSVTHVPAQPLHWWPRVNADLYGWSTAGGLRGKLGPYVAGRSTFRISLRRLSLPTPFLATLAVLAAVPPVRGWVRPRRGTRGFPVGPVPPAGEGADG